MFRYLPYHSPNISLLTAYRYPKNDIGTIVEQLVAQIINCPELTFSNIRTVNVWFPRSNVGTGQIDISNMPIFGTWPEMCVTFCTNISSDSLKNLKFVDQHLIRFRVRQWTALSEGKQHTFITVAFGQDTAQLVPQHSIMSCINVYESLNIIMTNIFRFKRFFQADWTSYETSLRTMKSFVNRDLGVLMQGTPFFNWLLCADLWTHFPNWIPPSFWSQWTAFFYLRCLHSVVKDTMLENQFNYGTNILQRIGILPGQLVSELVQSIEMNSVPYNVQENAMYINNCLGAAHDLKKYVANEETVLNLLWEEKK